MGWEKWEMFARLRSEDLKGRDHFGDLEIGDNMILISVIKLRVSLKSIFWPNERLSLLKKDPDPYYWLVSQSVSWFDGVGKHCATGVPKTPFYLSHCADTVAAGEMPDHWQETEFRLDLRHATNRIHVDSAYVNINYNWNVYTCQMFSVQYYALHWSLFTCTADACEYLIVT
jgi:hypothetical protein